MNRRAFLSQAGAMAPAGSARAQTTATRRNVVLLYCEQFQHDVASFAGGPARTPNLEAFAADAVNFRSACTTAALCSPARAALMTGRLGHRTGLDDNCNGWHSKVTALNLRQTTLIEWARKKGYFVGYFGKWHLGQDGPIKRGAQRHQANGFERQRTPGKVLKPNFSLTKPYYEAGRDFPEKPGFYVTERGTYETCRSHRLAESAVEFVREAAGRPEPFFLTASFQAVHPPYEVPKPYSTMYDWRSVKLPLNVHDDFKGKPDYQADIMWPFHDTGHMSDDDWRRSIAFYRGYVTLLDRALGEIFSALKSNGQWDNTLVIVIADHGDMNGAHNRFDKGPYCYDEGMRIPLMVRWPGIAPREVIRQVQSLDINQTIVEWAGLAPDTPNVDSRSLRPLMDAGDRGWSTPDEAFFRYEAYNGLWFGIRAIRTPEYKYCFNPGGIDELYSLRDDPGELHNLIDTPAAASTQQSLESRLLSHLEQTQDTVIAGRLKDYLEAKRNGARQ